MSASGVKAVVVAILERLPDPVQDAVAAFVRDAWSDFRRA